MPPMIDAIPDTVMPSRHTPNIQDTWIPSPMRKPSPTLLGTNLTRCFGRGDNKTYALNQVSIQLYPQEMNLLMGPSGSGKSTLLAVISALLHPDSGDVVALGENLWNKSDTELEAFRLRHCSYIFQGYNLFPALTATEQLEMVLRWGQGLSHRQSRQRAQEVLCRLGLSAKLHLRPAEMSGGEKQRVAIGRALVKNPSFLFADEPTSALDWENGQQVIELLHEVAHEQGATVLVVTHDPRLLSYADRVYEMADGQMCRGTDEIPTSRDEVEIVPLTLEAGPVPTIRRPQRCAGLSQPHVPENQSPARLRLHEPH